jgi:hypothetical protein
MPTWTGSHSTYARGRWAHTQGGSIELKAHGWSLCLTDPGNATKNGTQLVVASCRNKSDQHWSMP